MRSNAKTPVFSIFPYFSHPYTSHGFMDNQIGPIQILKEYSQASPPKNVH